MTDGFETISVALELEAEMPFDLRPILSRLLQTVVDALPGSAFGHIKALADLDTGKLYASCTISPPGVNFTPEDASGSPRRRATIVLSCILGGLAYEDLARALDAGLATLTYAGFTVRKEKKVE